MSVESIVQLAAGKIGELLVEEAKFLYGVEDQVRSLQEELTWMNSFLRDMEAIDDEGANERNRTVIREIRKIAYDAEDVIDSYILRAETTPDPPDKKVHFFKRYICFCSCVAQTHQQGCEIEAIKGRISNTMERLKMYRDHNGGRRTLREGLNRTRVRRPVSYSHNHEDHVFGLEEDINKFAMMLTDTNCQKPVLGIVGMGGSGKTTFARKLYNHKSVKNNFDCMAWVSISEEWVAQHILLEILAQVSGKYIKLDELWSPRLVADKLHEYLEGKRYLIVLDDVWKKQAMEEILPAFPSGNVRRKLIVTTRKKEVIEYPDLPCSIHEPRRLTEEESWELFRKIALSHRDETNTCVDIVALETLGKEMLKKCEGLPLAVIALAGLLGNKDTLEEWEMVKKSVSSRIVEDGRGTHLYGTVKEMLTLSYNDLPCELKPCFLYLANFPEDSEIPIGMLIRMWIAEGFITSDQAYEGDTLEDVARQYLDELINRCMVHIASRNYEGKPKAVQIHDLTRELCIKKAKEQDFLGILSSRSQNLNARVAQSRRTVIHSYNRRYFPFPTENCHLRSLLLFARANIHEFPNYDSFDVGIHKWHTNKVRPELSFEPVYKNFMLLRVLNLIGIDSSSGALPTEIGSLIHLRYLGLRVTNIYQLPSSIGNLRKLLTLDYRSVEEFENDVKVPDVLWKIQGLVHLYLPFGRRPMERLKFRNLKQLQTLCGVGGGSWMLNELPHLSENVQKLHIGSLTSAEQLEPIFHCQHLRKLRLDGRIDDRLGCIRFPFSIKKLELCFTQLGEEATLATIGKLPNLKFLVLLQDSYTGTKWTCIAGEFLQLKVLKLFGLGNLEEWSIDRGAMSQLQKLSVSYCYNLRGLPEGLKFIPTIQEVEFPPSTNEI